MITLVWFLPSMSSDKALPRKAMLNCLHLYSVSSDNDLPRKAMFHCLHLYGFSPVWNFRCSLSWKLYRKALSHWLHLYGSSKLWVLIIFCQKGCNDILFFVCIIVFVNRFIFPKNAMLWGIHWYGFIVPVYFHNSFHLLILVIHYLKSVNIS